MSYFGLFVMILLEVGLYLLTHRLTHPQKTRWTVSTGSLRLALTLTIPVSISRQLTVVTIHNDIRLLAINIIYKSEGFCE